MQKEITVAEKLDKDVVGFGVEQALEITPANQRKQLFHGSSRIIS